MAQMSMNQDKSSKLLMGVVIGGLIGGAVSLLDSTTRTKVKETAAGMKDTSMNMLSEVKENPSEIKSQMIQQFKKASKTLKEAISDAQNLYKTVNEEVFSKMGNVKELSNDAMSTAKVATEEIKGIGSKVKEAGSELVANPAKQTGANESSDSGSSTSAMNSTETSSMNSTGYYDGSSTAQSGSTNSSINSSGNSGSSSSTPDDSITVVKPDEQNKDRY